MELSTNWKEPKHRRGLFNADYVRIALPQNPKFRLLASQRTSLHRGRRALETLEILRPPVATLPNVRDSLDGPLFTMPRYQKTDQLCQFRRRQVLPQISRQLHQTSIAGATIGATLGVRVV